ncbi:hypothetical protein GCM10007049_34670 [Echinicola pacifica]|uniref:OmpR/PhoB-type domain-containing protein n=1 Tax=Echinicola pacifica TaxID=346377 RepID=A0A918QBC5_9BACT|nr:hypothetical protein [Echinicola pacifica]GGZ38580.1 hypothetical protein GCM10007049_34670 [Echinicola pacifica]
MLSQEKKNSIIEKIIASNSLKNAPTSIALLRYLAQAYRENRDLKESIIDLEFFGGDPVSSKSNPRVRVNIYNLRKRLQAYYEEDGAQDSWKIIIKKGQYGLSFEKTSSKSRFLLPAISIRIFPYLLSAILLGLLIYQGIPNTNPKIWKGFFENNQPTHLYIGDAFGYGGKTISGNEGWTRDFEVNNVEEYYNLVKQDPQLQHTTHSSTFYYSTRMAEYSTYYLSKLFTRHEQDFDIKYATQSTFADFKSGNTIYVGRMKDQKDFIYLFNEANPYVQIHQDRLQLKGHPQLMDSTIIINSTTMERDFTIVAHLPGPYHSEQFYFFSNHDIGVMAAMEFFTNLDSLERFAQKKLTNSPYFTALYMAEGQGRINLKLEEILIVPHESDSDSQRP